MTARRPSRSPAVANRNAPEHTEATRRARPAAARTHSTYAGSSLAARTPRPPTTTSVSIGSPAASAMVRCGTTAKPSEAVTGSAADATTSVSYRRRSDGYNLSACENTSSGPVRSSSWKSGKTRKTTRRLMHQASPPPPKSAMTQE